MKNSLPTLAMFLITASLSGCVTSETSSTPSASPSETAASCPGVEFVNSKPVHASDLPEFQCLGQSWDTLLANAGEVKLDSKLIFQKPASNGSFTIFMTDSIGFETMDDHGFRMLKSLGDLYPDVGVEALAMNAYGPNDPYFDENLIITGPEVIRRGMHVDSASISVSPNHYGLALAAEANQQMTGPKIFVSASTLVTSFNSKYLSYPDNGFTTWRKVPAKSGEEVEVNYSAYQMALWLEKYGKKHNLLFVSALENNYADASGNAVNCFQERPYPEDWTPVCGGEALAFTSTGMGLDSVLFVGNLDTRWNNISGWATGPYLENAIYSTENSVDNSNSFTAPTVAGFIATLVAKREQAGLSELSAQDWKRVIRSTTTKKEVNYIQNTVNGIVNYKKITVNLLNKSAAELCAINGDCLK